MRWLVIVAAIIVFLLYVSLAAIPWTTAHLWFDRGMGTTSMEERLHCLDKAICADPLFAPYRWWRNLLRLSAQEKSRHAPARFPLYLPLEALSWSNAAWLSAWRGNYAETDCIQQSIALDPTLPQYRLSAALFDWRRGNIQAARAELTFVTQRLAQQPPVAYLLLAQICERQGDYGRAKDFLSQGLHHATSREQMPGYQLPIRYRRIVTFNESIDQLPDLISEDLLHWEMAKVLKRLRQRGEAAKHHAEALRLNPALATSAQSVDLWKCCSIK